MNVHTAISQGETEPLTTLLNEENADLISADKEGRSSSYLLNIMSHLTPKMITVILPCLWPSRRHITSWPKDYWRKVRNGAATWSREQPRYYRWINRIFTISNSKNCTPLHSASNNGVEDLVQLLIKLGADVNAASINMNCPIHLATVNNHTEVLLHLLEAGANVNAKNSESYTAVHMAFLGGHEDCMFALLACGADTIQDPIVQRTAAVEAVKSGELMSGIMKKLETIERRAVNIRNIHDHYKRVSSEKTKEITDEADAEIEQWKKMLPQVEHILVKQPNASTKVQVPIHPEPASSEPNGVPPRKKVKLTKTPKSDSSIMLPD